MKKVFIVSVFITLAFLCYLHLENYGNNKENKNTEYRVVDEEVIVSNDLFGKHYTKANRLMKTMSLEEKIGQMFLVRYDSNLVNSQITNYHAGGFVLFARDFQNHTKASIKKELEERQKLSKIPLALAVDEEGGYVTRVSRFPEFRSEKFKSNRVLFEIGGYELVKTSEKEKAELLLSLLY